MFIMLPCSQRTLILVLELVGNFGVRLPPGCSRHGVGVHCLCVQMLSFYATRWPVFLTCMLTMVSWCVAIMLCCHCLSDALPMQSYPSKVWFLCATVQISVRHNLFVICLVSNGSIFLHEIGGILWLTLWRCCLHSTVECSFYSNVHFTSWIWFSA